MTLKAGTSPAFFVVLICRSKICRRLFKKHFAQKPVSPDGQGVIRDHPRLTGGINIAESVGKIRFLGNLSFYGQPRYFALYKMEKILLFD